MPTKTKIWEEEDVDVLDDIEDVHSIVVYNDNDNTFQWVIEVFMDILDHSSQQAEQLAMEIHFKGRAVVKSGALDAMILLAEALLDKGLTAEVQ